MSSYRTYFLESKNMDFQLSNAVSDVSLRVLVDFCDLIYNHHKNVKIWPFFQYDQFSDTVLGYKKGSKIKSEVGVISGTHKMWGVSFVTFPIRWLETLLSERPRGVVNRRFTTPPQDWLETFWQHNSWSERRTPIPICKCRHFDGKSKSFRKLVLN